MTEETGGRRFFLKYFLCPILVSGSLFGAGWYFGGQDGFERGRMDRIQEEHQKKIRIREKEKARTSNLGPLDMEKVRREMATDPGAIEAQERLLVLYKKAMEEPFLQDAFFYGPFGLWHAPVLPLDRPFVSDPSLTNDLGIVANPGPLFYGSGLKESGKEK